MKKREDLKQEKIKGKKGIVFDIDNTLLDAHTVFINTYADLEVFLKEKFGDSLGEELINGFKFDMYDDNGKYKNIIDMNFLAERFSEHLVELGLIKNTKEDRYEMEKLLKGIYQEMPDYLPGAQELLKHLRDGGYKIGFCTHSGEWGDIKAKGIWRDLDLPEDELIYLSIPLNGKKDAQSWKEVIEMMNLEPNEVVVIGDNKEADILPAQEIGVDTCVWYRYALPKDTNFYKDLTIDKPGCIVYEKDTLNEIKKLF
jgi:HAD superfamily hydrolase (TIGR01509 family)